MSGYAVLGSQIMGSADSSDTRRPHVLHIGPGGVREVDSVETARVQVGIFQRDTTRRSIGRPWPSIPFSA